MVAWWQVTSCLWYMKLLNNFKTGFNSITIRSVKEGKVISKLTKPILVLFEHPASLHFCKSC